MSFPFIIAKDRSVPLTFLSAIAGLSFIELLLIISLAYERFVFFAGGAFLVVLVLVILNDLDKGLYLLPIALGTSLMLIPAMRFHLAELVIVTISLSLIAHLGTGDKKHEWIFPQKGPILLFLFASAVSLSNATYLNAGITHLIKLAIAFVLVFGLVYNRMSSDRALLKASIALVLTGLVASVYGLAQYFSGPAAVTTSFRTARIFGRAGGLYGGVVGLSIVFLCSYLLFARKGRTKILACLFLVPPVFAFILSHIRAWYVGLLFALAFMVVLRIHKGRKSKSIIILATVGLLTLLLFFGFLAEQSLHAFKFLFIRGPDLPIYTKFLAAGISMDFSLIARLNMWSFAWKQFVKYPLTGVGVANFRISDALRPSLSRPVEGHAYADNHYVNILVETGILGTFAWMWLLANLFRSSRKLLRSSAASGLEWISVGLVASLLLFLVGGIFWCLTPLLNEACLTAFLFSLIFAAQRVRASERPPLSQMNSCLGG